MLARINDLAATWVVIAGSVENNCIYNFTVAFIEDGIISRPAEGDPVDFRIIFEEHEWSPRRTSKPRDFILAIMSTYKWHRAPQNSKTMKFGELYIDCVRQVSQHGIFFTPLFCFAPGNLGQIIFRPLPTAEIPPPVYFGDFIKLLSVESFSPVVHPDPEKNLASIISKSVDAQRVIGAINELETKSLVQQCMLFDTTLWSDFCKSTLKNPAWEECHWYEQPSKQDWAIGFENLTVLDVLYLLYVSSPAISQTPEVDLTPEVYELVKSVRLSRKCMDSLLYLASIISCRVPVSSFVWIMQYFIPVKIEFTGQPLLALAPKHLAARCFEGQGEFTIVCLREVNFLLIRWKDDMYVRCILPRKSVGIFWKVCHVTAIRYS